MTPYCLKEQFTCPTGSCLSASQVCDFTSQCSGGEDEAECGAGDFEDGMNGWQPAEDSDGAWDRTTGQDGFKDHTHPRGTGWYIEVQTIKLKRLQFASLLSPKFVSSDNNCTVSLYYAIWGTNDVGTISVHLKTPNGDVLLWNVTGNGQTGKSWTKADILVGARVDFQLELRGESGGKVLGYLAVDDVSYSGCEHGPPQPARITVGPTGRTLMVGDNVTFSCQATGVPTPTITWTRDGEALATGGQ